MNLAPIFGRILVAVGGSECSFAALAHALDLAKASHGALSILIVKNAISPIGSALASGTSSARCLSAGWPETIEEGTDEIERRAAGMAGARQVPVVVQREAGLVSYRILTNSKDASLVVMGRRGHGLQSDTGLGSNIGRVARRTEKPLLVTPASYELLKRVRVAYDGRVESPHALETGCEVAEALQVPLEVMTVTTSSCHSPVIQERVRRELPSTALKPSLLQADGDPAEVLAGQSRPDVMLVMGLGSQSRSRGFPLGSVAREVLQRSQGPILFAFR